jgi:hypothetical protein
LRFGGTLISAFQTRLAGQAVLLNIRDVALFTERIEQHLFQRADDVNPKKSSSLLLLLPRKARAKGSEVYRFAELARCSSAKI